MHRERGEGSARLAIPEYREKLAKARDGVSLYDGVPNSSSADPCAGRSPKGLGGTSGPKCSYALARAAFFVGASSAPMAMRSLGTICQNFGNSRSQSRSRASANFEEVRR